MRKEATQSRTSEPTNLVGPFDISGEESRIYNYPTHEVFIFEPSKLWVAESGSHRIQCLGGEVHYLPAGAQVISWYPRDIDNPVAM